MQKKMCEDAIPGRNCDVQMVSLVSSLSGQLQAWMESLHNIPQHSKGYKMTRV